MGKTFAWSDWLWAPAERIRNSRSTAELTESIEQLG